MKARKILTMVAALALTAALAIGGTLAYLTAKTNTVTNTFTVGKVAATLTESNSNQDSDGDANTNSYKMVPGTPIDKDPQITVDATSEDCWLFVKIEESSTLDTYIDYAVDSAWTPLTGVSGVYYIENPTKGTAINVIGYNTTVEGNTVFVPNKVLTKTSVTEAQMEALEVSDAIQPTLTFTACVVQHANLTTAADAYAQAPAAFTGATA